MSESNRDPKGASDAEASLEESVFQRRVTVRCFDKGGRPVRSFEMRGGMNLWVFLRKNGVPVGAACSGVGVCAACHVEVSPPEGVTEQGAFEKESLERNGRDPSKVRLACLCRVVADVSVSAEYW